MYMYIHTTTHNYRYTECFYSLLYPLKHFLNEPLHVYVIMNRTVNTSSDYLHVHYTNNVMFLQT